MRTRAVIVAGAAAVCAVLVVPAPARADGIRDAQWHAAFLDLPAAHRISQGDGVTVAIVDSGVDGTHPDLAGNLMPAVDATQVLDATSQSDVDGRGTGLAGLVAGHGHGTGLNNTPTPPPSPGATPNGGTGADGVLGIAPRARILPVVITTRPGQFGDPDVLADGIDLAVSRGAQVICVGRGMPATPRLEQSVNAAVRAGIVIVAPTGGRAGEAFLPWPAAYPGVVAVAGVDRAGNAGGRAASRPSLAAPGVDLVTTDARGGYRIEAGTGAAAIVAGAVALVRARYPQLPTDEVINRLVATSSDRGASGPDDEYGAGVLDLMASLTGTVPSLAPSTAPPTPGAAAPPVAAPSGTVAPPPAAGDGPRGLPAFATTDWRRWLVALPLIGFLIALTWFGLGGFRRRSGGPPPAALAPSGRGKPDAEGRKRGRRKARAEGKPAASKPAASKPAAAKPAAEAKAGPAPEAQSGEASAGS